MGFELEIKIKQLSEESVQEIKNRHAIKNEVVTHKGLDALLKKVDMLDMREDLCEGGLGHELHRLLSTSGKLYIDELLRWAHVEKNGR